MQIAVQIIIAALVLAAAAWIIMVVYGIARAASRRRLLRMSFDSMNDTPARTGISVLCRAVSDFSQVENLLSVEYMNYEVVLVLDSAADETMLTDILRRYDMVRVDSRLSYDLPVSGVRALFRSRRRCFRRLTVADKAAGHDTLDMAVSIASYDYLLPLPAGCYLLPDAVERLAVEVGGADCDRTDIVVTRGSNPIALYSRAVIMRNKGFSPSLIRRTPRRRIRIVNEPLTIMPYARRKINFRLASVTVLLLAGIVASLFAGFSVWVTLALAATLLLAVSAVLFATPYLAPYFQGRKAVATAISDFR